MSKISGIFFLLLLSFNGLAQLIDTNIVLVNFGHLNREGIATQIAIVKKYNPKIIALDAFFTKDSLGKDSLLLAQLEATPNLVMICSFTASGNEEVTFKESHPKFVPKNTSHINLLASPYKGDFAITAFTPFIEYKNETYAALGITMAKAMNPAKTARFLNKHTLPEDIRIHYHYPTLQFQTLSEDQILNKTFNPELLRDKIVLIGFMGTGDEDLHPIPFTDTTKIPVKLYGIQIHAHIIHMILEE